MKRSAVVSIVSASPVVGVAVDELLPEPARRAAGGARSGRAIATASSSSSSCGTTAWTSPISSALLGVDDVGGEREPARPVAADHRRAAHDAVARAGGRPSPRGTRTWRARTRSRCRRRGELGAAAERDAVHRRDHGQLGPLDRVEGVEDEPEVAPDGGRCSRSSANDAMSPPAENASPAPVSTIGPHAVVRVERVEHLRAARGRTSGTSRSSSRAGRSDDRDRVSALDAENLELVPTPP